MWKEWEVITVKLKYNGKTQINWLSFLELD